METSETFGPLKAALECPRLYIFNYVSELKNHVDLECQNFLHDQENINYLDTIQFLKLDILFDQSYKMFWFLIFHYYNHMNRI